jgi:trehalose/maltose hydrolase-like predicted phosphorylase
MLQAVIFGFGGIQLSDAGISQIKSKLPAKWKRLELKGVGVTKKSFEVR